MAQRQQSDNESEVYKNFYSACRSGKVDEVKHYLDAKLRADWVFHNGNEQTLVMATAWRDQAQVCAILLETGTIDLNAIEKSRGYTALHICAKQNSLKVSQLLLNQGADANAVNSHQLTALMICADLDRAEIAKQLLKVPNIDVNRRSSTGFTALMKAVFENSDEVFQLLIEQEGLDVKAVTNKHYTVLHLCAQHNRTAMANSLFRRFAELKKPEVLNAVTKDVKHTPFTLAAYQGHEEMLDLLYEKGADVLRKLNDGVTSVLDLMKNSNGEQLRLKVTAWYNEQQKRRQHDQQEVTQAEAIRKLHEVAQNGSVEEMTEICCNSEVTVDSRDTDSGRTPLMLAAISGNTAMAQHLILNGADVNATDSQGNSALLHSLIHRKLDVAYLLIDKGKDGVVNVVGRTAEKEKIWALKLAVELGNIQLMRRLKAAGAKVDTDELLKTAREAHQQEAELEILTGQASQQNLQRTHFLRFYQAALHGDVETVRILLVDDKIIDDVDHRHSEYSDRTALMAAASADKLEMVQFLLKLGADPIRQDKNGIIALHIAVQQSCYKSAEALVKFRKTPDHLDFASMKEKRTALMRCAWLDNRKIGKLLLDSGANADLQDKDGFTALHLSAQQGHLEFVKMLVQYDASLDLTTNQSKNSYTAYSLAAALGHRKVLELLKDVGADVQNRQPLDPAGNRQGGHKMETRYVVTDAGLTNIAWCPAPDLGSTNYVAPIIDPDGYRMHSEPRGLCIIVNNSEFTDSAIFPQRIGSEADVNEAQRLFRRLKFRVQVHQNLDAVDMHHLFDGLAADRHAEYDCFVCFLMSHGYGPDHIFGSDCVAVQVRDLTAKVCSCRTLRNKPKLFFVQACRNPAANMERMNSDWMEQAASEGIINQDRPTNMQQVSDLLDLLIAYSTMEGQVSFRAPTGSLFIQTLCRVISSDCENCDVINILQRVRRELANYCELPITTSDTTQLRSSVWLVDRRQ